MVASEQDDNESLQLSDIETQERFSSQDGDEDALWSVDEITGEKDQRYKVKWSGVDPKTNRPWPQSWVAKKDVTLPVVVKWKTKKALKKKEAERRKSLKRRESTASKRTHASTVSRSTAGSSGTPLTVTAKPTAKKAASSESSTKTVRANAASVSTTKPEDDIPLLGKRRRGSIASNSSWDLPEVGSLFPAPPDANQAKKKRKIVPDDAGDYDVEDNGEDVRDWPTHLPSPPPLPLSQTSSRRRILAPSTEGSDFHPGLLIRDDETPAAGPSSKAAKGKERRPPSDDEDTELDYRKIGPPPRRGSRVTRASGKSASSSVTTKGGDNGVANGIAHPDKTVAHKSATRKGPPPPLKGNSKSGSTSRATLSKSIPQPKSPLPASTRRATRQPLFLKDPDEGNGGEAEDEEDAESETEKVRKGIKKQGDVVVVKHKKSRKAAEVDEEEQEEEEGESEVSTKMVSRHASSKPPSKTVSNPPLPPQAPPAKRNRQMVVELASPARVQKPLATVEQPPSTRPPPDHVPIPNTRNTLKLTHSRKLSDGTLARLKEFDEEVGMTGYPIPDISDPAPSALPEPAPLAKRGSSGVRESTITTGAVAGPSRSKTTAASNQRTGGNDSEVVPGTETQSSQSQSQSQPQAPPFASLPGANTRPRALPSTNPLPALNTLHAPTARKVPTSSTIHPSTVPIPAGPSSRPSIPPIATVEVDTRTSPGPSRPPSESAVTKPAPLPAPPPLRTPIRSSGSLAGKMKPRTPGSRRSTMLSVLEQDLAVPEPLLDGAEYPGEPTEGEDEESYHPGQPDAGVEDADGEGDQMDVDVESESEEERRRKARSSDRGKGVKREKENQVHRSKDKDKTKRPEKQLKPLPHLSPSKFAPYLSSSSPPDDISSRRPRGRGKSSKTATIFDRRRGMVQRQSDPVNDSIESFSSPIKKTSTKKTSMGKVLVPSSSSQSQPPATVAPAATGPVEVNEISASDKDLVEKVRKEILLAASGGAKKPTLLKWMKETKAKQANEAQGGKEKVWDSSIRQFSSSNPQQQKEKQVHTVDEQPTVEELEEAYVDLSGATPGEDGGADVALDDRDEDQESRYEEEMVEEEVTIEDEDADADAEDELDDDDNRPVQPIPEEEEESPARARRRVNEGLPALRTKWRRTMTRNGL
ncbi:hypothetical protein BDN72DRAFT_507137 [Pluteus cervinus]|uniref:Uncharacterized protein n=1 Tax=Pluteus cervinus TaxID=181527 RepID=A0ACD3A467_9AGAR|nr:hypothetical protein BDN72DRAFT_507137 [Pluteus cervinus]